MEKYRVYSQGHKNVVEVVVGVERDWQFYGQQGLTNRVSFWTGGLEQGMIVGIVESMDGNNIFFKEI